MLRKIFLNSLFIACIFLGLSLYFLYFVKLDEKRYNKIICYYVARSLTQEEPDFEEKVALLRNFVHENVLPVGGYQNKLSVRAVEKLTSGIGWCDQQARVFMQLARSIDITTRLLFLKSESGSSPHSIAEALAPDGRWVIADVGNNLDLVNKEGKPATQADIKKDITILTENNRVKAYAKSQKLWYDTAYISMYYNPPEYVTVKEGAKVDFLKPVPRCILRPIIALISYKYLSQIKPDIENRYEFEMVKGRIFHLLDYYDKAKEYYADIIVNSADLPLIRKSEYYCAMLLSDQKRYDAAYNFITNTIGKYQDNPYVVYLYSLRSDILYKMDKPRKAEEDLKKISYSLDA